MKRARDRAVGDHSPMIQAGLILAAFAAAATLIAHPPRRARAFEGAAVPPAAPCAARIHRLPGRLIPAITSPDG